MRLTAMAAALVVGFSLMSISVRAADSTDTKTDKKPAKEKAKGDKKVDTHTVVIIDTSEGPIEVELNAEKAPLSTANFLKYVDEDFYSGTIFHRVIKDFMIQGGGFDKDMKQKDTHEPVKNEANNGLKNLRYTVAMARTSVVDSATAQFFINTKDNEFLNYKDPMNYGYAVFGRVTSGQNVVDKIAATPTTRKNGMADVPERDIVIKSVKRKH